MIELAHVSKVFRQDGREVRALEDVTLPVAPGEIFGVLGQSGAGKSTLIRCVNLLERPTSGQVRVDGQELTTMGSEALRLARQHIGMIFQQFNLFQSRTVAGNVAYPLEVAGWPAGRIRERVAELLALVGLTDKAGVRPAQLSGGQKQRVGIARALASGPKILLSDEATSALDPETTRSVLQLLREINRKLNVTILLITHQMEVVKEICDSVAILEDGRLVEQGRVVDLIVRPGSRLHQLFYGARGDVAWSGVPGATRLALTFTGERAEQPIITQMARRFGVDANVVEGVVERVGATRVGRLLVELTGGPEAVAGALHFLREQGLAVEPLDEPAPGGHRTEGVLAYV